MRIFTAMLSIALITATAVAQKAEPVELTEPKSGVSVMLPPKWAFVTAKGALIATPEDKSALVVLAQTQQEFGAKEPDVQQSMQRSNLKDLEVESAALIAEDELGGLEALIAVRGSGIDEQGEKVEFSALITKSGDTSGLVLGAWRSEASKKQITAILESLHVKQEKAETAGLALKERGTGAAITMPPGWVTVASRKGIFAVSEKNDAMAWIIRPHKDQKTFEAAVQGARAFLKSKVLDEVEMKELEPIDDPRIKGSKFARLVGADGEAVSRADGKPVKLRVLAAQDEHENNVAVVFGAWKNDKAKAAVESMFRSIKFSRKQPAKKATSRASGR